MGVTDWWPGGRLRPALERCDQLSAQLRAERSRSRDLAGRVEALRGALAIEQDAAQAYRDKAAGERAYSERCAAELAQIRAAMDRVVTFAGVVDQSPLPMLIDGLVRDNSELEARIEAALLRLSEASDLDLDFSVDRAVALLRGAPRVPDSPEGLATD